MRALEADGTTGPSQEITLPWGSGNRDNRVIECVLMWAWPTACFTPERRTCSASVLSCH